MEVLTIDLTDEWVDKEDQFEFPLDDDLTDQILADLDCQPDELLKDFPNCSISPPRKGMRDVLGKAVAETILDPVAEFFPQPFRD